MDVVSGIIEGFEIGDELWFGRGEWTFTCKATGKVFTWENSDYEDIYRYHKKTGHSLAGEIRIPAFVGSQTVTNVYLGRSAVVDVAAKQEVAQRFLQNIFDSLASETWDGERGWWRYPKFKSPSWDDAVETADMPVRITRKDDFWQ